MIVSGDGIKALALRLARASKDAEKDFRQAVGTMARAAKTETKRASAKVYNVSQTRIEKDVRVTSDANAVTITGYKRSITFNSYGFVATATGLRGSLFKSGKRHTFKSGFKAPGLAGNVNGFHLVPFWRVGPKRKMRKGRYAGKLRQPLESLHGPSVADMLKNDKVSEPLTTQLLGRAASELRRRISRAIKDG